MAPISRRRRSPLPIDPLLIDPLAEGFVGDNSVPTLLASEIPSGTPPPAAVTRHDPPLVDSLLEGFVGDIPVPPLPDAEISSVTLPAAAVTRNDASDPDTLTLDAESVGPSQAETSGPASFPSDIPVNMPYDDWMLLRRLESHLSEQTDIETEQVEEFIDPGPDTDVPMHDAALPGEPQAPTAIADPPNSHTSKKVIKTSRSTGVSATAKAQKLRKNPSRAVTKDAIVPQPGPSQRGSVQCPECGKTMLKKNFDRHFAAKHQGTKYLCPICHDPLTYRGDVKRHIASCHPTDPRSSGAADSIASEVLHDGNTEQPADPAPVESSDLPAAPHASTSRLEPPMSGPVTTKRTRSAGVSATAKAQKFHKNSGKTVIKSVQVSAADPIKPSQVTCDQCGKVLHKNSLSRHIASQHKRKK